MKLHTDNDRLCKTAVSGLLLIFAVCCANFEIGFAKSTSQTTKNNESLEEAKVQLKRMSSFRRMAAPRQKIIKLQLKKDTYDTTRAEVPATKDILVVQEGIHAHAASASVLLRDLKYRTIAQDRIKRSFISGIANKLLSGIAGAAGSTSRGIAGLSSSNAPSEYGSHGPAYQAKFDVGDFAKAIINTLIQAIKAIGGGAIAGGGALIKGGGFIVSAKGQIISSAGNAITSLGKSIASSAIIASPKPVHGHAGYSYNYQSSQEPNHDLSYDGPPPSAEAYTNPDGAYDMGPSSYGSPSNDNHVNNQASILTVKNTNPEHGPDNHPLKPFGDETNPSLALLAGSFKDSLKGPRSLYTKIVGVLTSGQPVPSDHYPQQDHFDHHGKHKYQLPASQLPSFPSYAFSSPENQNERNDYKNIYQAYYPIGQMYNSYDIVPQLFSLRLEGDQTKSRQASKIPRLLTYEQIQAKLNAYMKFPELESTAFDQLPFLANYHYHEHPPEPELLSIPTLRRQ